MFCLLPPACHLSPQKTFEFSRSDIADITFTLGTDGADDYCDCDGWASRGAHIKFAIMHASTSLLHARRKMPLLEFHILNSNSTLSLPQVCFLRLNKSKRNDAMNRTRLRRCIEVIEFTKLQSIPSQLLFYRIVQTSNKHAPNLS